MRNPRDQLSEQLLSWQPSQIGSLVYLLRNNPRNQQAEVLLIEKQNGHGQGLINGPGGKLEPTETIYACARRELQEEIGVRAHQPKLCARIRFVDLQGPPWPQWLGFVFTVTSYSGSPTATTEAIPAWYALPDIPWPRMWPSDQLWLPKVLAAQQVEVNLLFNAGELLAEQVLTSAAQQRRANLAPDQAPLP